MYETFWVIGKNYPIEGMHVSRKIGETIIGRCRNLYIALLAATLKHDNNVLLQDIIILKCLVS